MSFILNMYNYHYLEYHVTNQGVKNLLIEHFWDKACFSYPLNLRNSLMFFSASICSRDVVENLYSKDPIKLCATKLWKECEEFDFLLYASYYDAQDLKISLEQYKNNYFELWETFFKRLSPFQTKAQYIRRKTDIIFKIIYSLIHNDRKKTPIRVALSVAIYNVCQSKMFIWIMKHLSLCTSYEEVERIYTALVQHTLDMAGSHRVLVSSSFVPHELVRRVMDSFDHKENTVSSIRRSHNTMLMLFQNTKDTERTLQWTVTDK